MPHAGSFSSWENAAQPWTLCCTELGLKGLQEDLEVKQSQTHRLQRPAAGLEPRLTQSARHKAFIKLPCLLPLPSLTTALQFLLQLSSDPQSEFYY